MIRKRLILLPLLLLIACRHNINTNNPKVVFAALLADASNVTVSVEDGLTTANRVLETIQTSEPEYYNRVKPLIRKISAANVTAALKIQAAKNGGADDWRGALLAVAASVNPNDLRAVGLRNPQTQSVISAAIAGLITVLSSIPDKFGGVR